MEAVEVFERIVCIRRVLQFAVYNVEESKLYICCCSSWQLIMVHVLQVLLPADIQHFPAVSGPSHISRVFQPRTWNLTPHSP